jgi:TolA-binding protein
MADKTTASMQDVHRKIEREKVLINGARAMRSSTDNTAVQQRLDNQIRESQRNLEYLEGKYKELEGRLMGQNTRGMENMQVSDNGTCFAKQSFPQHQQCSPDNVLSIRNQYLTTTCSWLWWLRE